MPPKSVRLARRLSRTPVPPKVLMPNSAPEAYLYRASWPVDFAPGGKGLLGDRMRPLRTASAHRHHLPRLPARWRLVSMGQRAAVLERLRLAPLRLA